VYTEVRQFPAHLYNDVYASQTAYRMMMDAAERTARGEWGRKQLWWYKKRVLDWLEREAPGRRLLDVGCGPGTFLLVARREGWNVSGVEPTREASNKAISLGLDVFPGYLKDYAATAPLPFDAIVSFEVLEHVPDPVPQLRGIRDLLKPGGILVLSVPNLDDPYCLKQQIAPAMPPVHINFFNRRSLGRAIREAGLVIDRFKSLPIPTSSVRNIHGKNGFYLRLPWLSIASLVGRADGTTLLAVARRPLE
jgi:2-polyprenyl-3-methyl-5-hydroxy-6-metoxy-1,4-benzoquinol methylase